MTADKKNQNLRIAILGCGFMGTAVLQAWLKDAPTAPGSRSHTYSAHVRTAKSLQRLKRDLTEYGSDKQLNLSSGDGKLVETAAGADVVILGFLPTQLGPILQTPGLADQLKGTVVISILAGISTDQLLDALVSNSSGPDAKKESFQVAAVNPTLGANIEESVTLLATTPTSESEPHTALVEELFSHIGAVKKVPEHLMASAIAIGAAVHALTIVAVDAITDASVAEGVPRSTAAEIATLCLRSGSGLLSHGGLTPESMKTAMSTPGGITLNSLLHLDAHARPGIAGAVRHAIQYTKKMNE